MLGMYVSNGWAILFLTLLGLYCIGSQIAEVFKENLALKRGRKYALKVERRRRKK
jgi:hypothetical protein